MAIMTQVGAVALPEPPMIGAPETDWNAYWGLCHSLIQTVPDWEGRKYKTHRIREEGGKYFGDIDWESNGVGVTTPVPGQPLPVEPEPEQIADAMLAAGDLSAKDETYTGDIVRQPVAGETPSAPVEVLPPGKTRKPRMKKEKGVPVPATVEALVGTPEPVPVVPVENNLPTPPVVQLPQLQEHEVPATVAAIQEADIQRNGPLPDHIPVQRLTDNQIEGIHNAIATAEMGQVLQEAFAAPITGDHAERKHHAYSMSKLNHLDDCSGFKSRDGSSEAADEGTALHEIVECILSAWLEYNAAEPIPITLVQALAMALENGLTMPNGAKMEDGQVDAVRDVLREIDWQIPGATEIYIEEKLPISNPDGSQLNTGHIDLVIGFATGQCTVIDYKFGKGQVRDASRNYQGFGYAMSFLQAHQEYDRSKILFVQPRISFKTEHMMLRSDIPGIYHRINAIIDNAENPEKQLRAGDQCRYCAVASKCVELAKYVGRIGSSYENLPAPTTFHGSQITDPVDMALALYWAKRAEPAIEGIKKAAVEMARQGMDLAIQLPGGNKIQFELGERSAARKVGAAPLVYKLIKNVLSPEEFTACVDVKLGDLEKVFVDAYQARLLATSGEKITKKAATEYLGNLLNSEGLVTRSDERTYFLKEKSTVPEVQQLQNV